MNRDNDIYNFFMDLNPLREAYLYFVDSNINIDALRMLSFHDDPRVANSKIDLLSNVSNDLNNAIVQGNFKKVRNINSACIQMEGERTFLERLSREQSLHQPLIDANIIRINSGEIMLQEQQSSSSSSPRPRP